MSILEKDDRELLHRGFEQLELPVEPENLDWYEHYIRELQLWNRRVRLISGSPREIIIRHILDSLAPWQLIRSQIEELPAMMPEKHTEKHPEKRAMPLPVEIADVGSGNGFPAIPLAGLVGSKILPPARFTLVERGAKKAAFLRSTAGLLGLFELVQVEEKDVRQVDHRVNMVISRAFMPLSEAFPLLAPLIHPWSDGTVLFYSGRRDSLEAQLERLPEFQEDESNINVKIWPVEVPFLEEERHLCRIYIPLR